MDFHIENYSRIIGQLRGEIDNLRDMLVKQQSGSNAAPAEYKQLQTIQIQMSE